MKKLEKAATPTSGAKRKAPAKSPKKTPTKKAKKAEEAEEEQKEEEEEQEEEEEAEAEEDEAEEEENEGFVPSDKVRETSTRPPHGPSAFTRRCFKGTSRDRCLTVYTTTST